MNFGLTKKKLKKSESLECFLLHDVKINNMVQPVVFLWLLKGEKPQKTTSWDVYWGSDSYVANSPWAKCLLSSWCVLREK